jgi:hypothetical protein
VLSGEATNTNLIVFGLTRQGLEPMIYRTRDEYANHYIIDAVIYDDDAIRQNVNNLRPLCESRNLDIEKQNYLNSAKNK